MSVKALITIFKLTKENERCTLKQFANNVYSYDISQASRQHIAGQPGVARGPLIEYAAICHWIFLNCGHRKQSNNKSQWHSRTFRRFSSEPSRKPEGNCRSALFISLLILLLPYLLFKYHDLSEMVYSSHKINTSSSNAWLQASPLEARHFIRYSVERCWLAI